MRTLAICGVHHSGTFRGASAPILTRKQGFLNADSTAGLPRRGSLYDGAPPVKLNQQLTYCNYIWLNGKWQSVGVMQLTRHFHPVQDGADPLSPPEGANEMHHPALIAGAFK